MKYTDKLPDLDTIKQAAAGRWPDILTALGIPEQYLSRKHQPCPSCGGRDRYRFTDWQGMGGYICNQCTPEGGSGFDLLMLAHGYDFITAVQDVADALGMTGDEAPQRKVKIAPAPTQTAQQDKLAKLDKILGECMPAMDSVPVMDYLTGRGLDVDIIRSGMRNLYAHAGLPYWYIQRDDRPQLLGNFPAMVGAIRLSDGTLSGLHITYLQDSGTGWRKLSANHPQTGEPLPAKKMHSRYAGALKGAAVPLYRAPDESGRIAVAEGIENALAAREMFGLPVYAAASAWGLRNVDLPPDTQSLYIVSDNDDNQTGQQAAAVLTRRAIKAGVRVGIWTPPTAGRDVLDELNYSRGNA